MGNAETTQCLYDPLHEDNVMPCHHSGSEQQISCTPRKREEPALFESRHYIRVAVLALRQSLHITTPTPSSGLWKHMIGERNDLGGSDLHPLSKDFKALRDGPWCSQWSKRIPKPVVCKYGTLLIGSFHRCLKWGRRLQKDTCDDGSSIACDNSMMD
ncbi:hypothetical protein HD806DRAFT_378752 [Xylariaceae sp. AK1471]|nr:hypothetical protein HD806DRAFT_378752 [Xylariaceae sp. AK1471]